MAGDDDPPRGAELGLEQRERRADLGDDAVHADRRRERVFDQRDIDAVGQRPLGDAAVILLVGELPVAAMDEDERRARPTCRRDRNPR